MEKEKSNNQKQFSQQIGEKENRKIRALKEEKRSVWLGLGMFGMVGWSIAAPTLAGTALGLWLDEKYPQTFSWTLTLLFAGLVAGVLIAWKWVARENHEMHRNKNENI